jgi:predicted GNAT family acetyltransferase
MAVLRPTRFQSFSLRDDSDGLWVAVDAGEILGFAFSWVCGDLWFLAELFVNPGHQGRGIGRELMKRTLDHAKKRGAVNRALITFTFNTVSQGLYIRHGMFPRLPIYHFNVAREFLIDRLKGAQLRYAPLEDKASHLHTVAHIDRQALGVSREKHHRHLINESGIRGVVFYAEDDCVGYAYISPDGHVGPLAVAEPKVLGPAFNTALHLAAKSSKMVERWFHALADLRGHPARAIARKHKMAVEEWLADALSAAGVSSPRDLQRVGPAGHDAPAALLP